MTRQNNEQRQLFLVVWLSGMKKSGHQDAANKINTTGGVQWGKE
jgi:hypothetical protein